MNDFFAGVYEFFYYQTADNFSQGMYDFSLYGITGIVTLLVAVLTMAAFYFLVNSSRFNKWYHWLLFLGINFAIVFAFTYFYPKNIFYDQGEDVGLDLFVLFALVNALFGTIYYFVFSVIFKRFSINASTSPF